MGAAKRLLPALSRDAWLLLGGVGLSALGSGLTLPFLLVYLQQVRGLELEVAALAVSTVALAGLAGNPLGGSLADRLGPRDAVAAGLVLAAGRPEAFFLGLVVCCGALAFGWLRLERRLPASVNLVPALPE